MAGGSVPDNGPLMSGCVWSITAFCVLFLIARTYVRITRSRGLWWDDWALILSWFCLLGETASTQAAIGYGFGKYVKDIPKLEFVFELVVWGQVGLTFVAFAIALSKISFALTMLRLTDGWWRILVWFIITTIGLLSIPAAILPWTICQPFEKSLDPSVPGKCFYDKYVAVDYGIFMAGWNSAMDFILAGIPWTVLWKLKMNTTEKIGVCACMSLGLLAGVIAIIRSMYIKQFASTDFSYNGVDITCWSAAETAAAIIAASIPVLRVFIREKTASAYGDHDIDEIHLSRVGGSNTDPKDPRNVVNEVWISAHRRRQDNDSDRSILREEGRGSLPDGQILQTSTFMIDTHSDEESGRVRQSNGSKEDV